MRHSQLRPQGWFFFWNAWGERQEGETIQCVHCGGHFEASPGSGRLRGFCQRCNGHICGPGCLECVPEEMLLERIEAGIHPDLARQLPRPATVSVPVSVQGGIILGG